MLGRRNDPELLLDFLVPVLPPVRNLLGLSRFDEFLLRHSQPTVLTGVNYVDGVPVDRALQQHFLGVANVKML